MKALLLSEYRQLNVVEMPTPEIAPNEVLVRVGACGICGSDVHGYDGSTRRRIPPQGMSPAGALRRVAELTFDHHESHPDFIRLVTIENIHAARHLATAPALSELANPALDVLTRILSHGRAAGEFRDDVDALDVHMLISSFCVFRTANRHTFDAIFGRDMLDAGSREHYREMLAEVVLRYVAVP